MQWWLQGWLGSKDAILHSGEGPIQEIRWSGTLIAWANQLGRKDAAKLFEQTLKEEEATDKKLTTLAESKVNKAAA